MSPLKRPLLTSAVLVLLGYAAVRLSLSTVPADDLAPRRVASREVWSSDHVLLDLLPNAEGSRCAWRRLAELDPTVVSVFIASEDRRFREHPGVDLRAIARAARTGGSGASTITMQLARLLEPHPRGLLGKLREARLALRLERTLTKDELLEQYLNRVPLGRDLLGVEAAAWAYFGHSAQRLSLAEATLLAALAPAPARRDPRTSLEAAREARDRLLRRLADAGAISIDARDAALATAVRPPRRWPSLAPHLRARLDSGASSTRLFLDARLQAEVERVVATHRQRLRVLGVDQVAVVVIEPRTNGLLAHVGSFAFGDAAGGQVDHALARRQAGSTLKPFLYALRLEDGATAASPVPDFVRAYREGDALFVPRNLDEAYRGQVPLRVALASSFNAPAVATAEAVGVERFRATLDRLGLRLERPTSTFGLGLALGVADVRLLDLTSAFSVFARDGLWSPARLVDDGTAPADVRVFPAATARTITSVLSDEAAREPGFGALGRLGLPFPVALKTGTSSLARDFWALGSTSTHTVGVWAGNSDGAPAEDVVAAEVALPLLVDVLRQATR